MKRHLASMLKEYIRESVLHFWTSSPTKFSIEYFSCSSICSTALLNPIKIRNFFFGLLILFHKTINALYLSIIIK